MGILIVIIVGVICSYLFFVGIRERRSIILAIAVLLVAITSITAFWVHREIREYDLKVEELLSQKNDENFENKTPDSIEENIELITEPGEASCTTAILRNSEGEELNLPEELREVFSCLPGGVVLSPNSKFLVFPNDNDLKIYLPASEETLSLQSISTNLEGLDCIWNEDSKKIACVIIDQNNEKSFTQIIVLEINELGELIAEKEFFPDYEETVDFTCGASCYPGKFWFENDNEIKYQGHNIISPDQIYSIKISN